MEKVALGTIQHCVRNLGAFSGGFRLSEHDFNLAEPILRNYSLKIICRYQKLRFQWRLAEYLMKENIFMLN